MSGNQIGSVIGAAIGALLAPTTGGMSLVWASRGMSIGGMIGGMLMPDEVGIQDQNGPRLSDLKITSATYGAAINRVYGAYRIGGNIIYSSDIKETKHTREEEVGKGGSESYEVITYTYSVDMAIAFCEGEVGDVVRIWADSVLIYDTNQGGYTSEFRNTEQKSGDIEIYKGSSTQDVDWFLESVDSDSPAYRNVCYIRFKDFQLGMFGNRIPNISAEILSNSERVTSTLPTIYSIQRETQWIEFSTIISANREKIRFVVGNYDNGYNDVHWTTYDIYPSGNSKEIATFWRYNYDDEDVLMCDYGTDEVYQREDFRTETNDFLLGRVNQGSLKIVDCENPTCPGTSVTMPSIPGKTIHAINISSAYITKNEMYISLSYNRSSELTSPYSLVKFNLDGQSTDIVAFEPEFISENNVFTVVRSYNSFVYLIGLNRVTNLVTIVKYTESLIFIEKFSTTEELPPIGSISATIDIEDGLVIFTTNLKYQSINLETQEVSKRLSHQTYVTPISSINNDGIVFSMDTYTTDTSKNPVYRTLKFDRSYYNGASNTGQKLSDIVAELLEASGIYEYDVSDGDSIFVYGFFIDKVSSTRSAISILQSAYSFDLVEEGFQIVLRVRKSDVDHTFLYDDLLDGYNIKNKLDTQLPKKVTFKYANNDIDYLTSSQSSIRVGGNSDNNVAIEFPIVLTDSEAKKLTEVNLFKAWSGKTIVSFMIPLVDVSVSNLVKVTIDEVSYIIRLTSILITSDYRLECEGIVEGEGINDSSAVGSDTSQGFTKPEISILAPSDLMVFNSPTLDNSVINSNGLLYACKGFGSSWNGASIFKSKDLGQTYENVGSSLIEACFGETRSILPDGPTTLIDLTGSVQVYSSTNNFIDITYQDLFNGKNYIKIGDEVLQYMEYTDDGNNLYTLSTFLRGRRGTEWATNLHSSLEAFILLDFESIQFSFSTYNTERIYKAATFGTYIDDAYEELVTYDGTNLKPLAPAAISVLNGIIYWERRDRYIAGYLRTLPNSEVQELYKVEFFYLNVSQGFEEISNTTQYEYNQVIYPNVDKIQISQYSNALLDYGYVSEIII